ncbi:hypothetical protein Bca52824_064342 [Brassica carinata]|uniref:Uncharacterized protein n=1 Tax=Brassica carinata TaxID=52824 RepID=A0A8X7QI62_BRACI|nr:hypothetical protein Bca52824_064342 [Brassica carinata]
MVEAGTYSYSLVQNNFSGLGSGLLTFLVIRFLVLGLVLGLRVPGCDPSLPSKSEAKKQQRSYTRRIWNQSPFWVLSHSPKQGKEGQYELRGFNAARELLHLRFSGCRKWGLDKRKGMSSFSGMVSRWLSSLGWSI